MNSRSVIGRALCVAQGAYYVAGGVWPLIDRRTFERVTGRKRDFWLAQTCGLQLALAGAILLAAGRRSRATRETALLGSGTAAILLAMDLWSQTQPRTKRTYLVDAVTELGCLVAWAAAAVRTPKATDCVRLMPNSRNAPMARTPMPT